MLQNQLPVMLHLWSEMNVPRRSKALAPVLDEIAHEFEGQLDAVRTSSSPSRACDSCFQLLRANASLDIWQQRQSREFVLRSTPWPLT